jgi:hypothetical protein
MGKQRDAESQVHPVVPGDYEVFDFVMPGAWGRDTYSESLDP